VAGGSDLPGELRIGAGLAADHEEDRLQAFVRQRLEHCVGVGRERSVVECQHHLAGRERQCHAVVVAADQRQGARVHRHHAADAHRIWVGARCGVCAGAAEREGADGHSNATHPEHHCGKNR